MLNLNFNRCDWRFIRVAIARPIMRAYCALIQRSSALTAAFVLFFVVVQAHAGEIEPRSYVNTPVGINFLLAGYAYSDGGLSTAGSSPIKDAELRMNTAYWPTHEHWTCLANQGSSMS
jgi:hypothetical protein